MRPGLAWSWLVGAYVVLLTLFLAVPMANMLVLSAYQYSPITIWSPVLTSANYAQLLDPYLATVALRTLRIGATATILCTLIGYPVAYYLARCSRLALIAGLFVLLLPMMVSAVVGAFGWIVILGRNGLLNTWLRELGLPRINVLYTDTAVLIALVHFLLPLMVLPLLAAIERIPVRLEEAATNLGTGPFGTFRRVILPLSRAGLASGALLCFCIAISVIVIPTLLGGRTGRMLGNEIYEQMVTVSNWPYASSLSVALILVVLGVMSVALAAARDRRRTR